MEDYRQGIGISAGSFMLKWDVLDQELKMHQYEIQPGEEVNIFINFECILRNLSMQKGLLNLVTFHKQQLVIELEAAILNLMANYRAYFKKYKCKPKLFFYYTALDGSEQQMSVYNKYYRHYYYNRYTQNPQFNLMGQVLTKTIIPEVELILSYIPGCYFVTSRGYDSSLIPYIVSTIEPAKNIIITGDIFDTLYMCDPNFFVIYIKRRFKYFALSCDIHTTVGTIIKDESPFDINVFNAEMYYRLLLSIKGSRIRNIASAKGFGYGKFMRIISDGMRDGVVLRDFESLDSIIQLFPARYQEDIKAAFQCTSIETQFALLSEADVENVKSQLVDRTDYESLQALNNRRFLDFPINLQSLIG